ncbi:hypothetical protein ACTL6P_22835 [Endozoicomonas acroporae]|uniref:hypothetical protein n=1 Tax=Endozoicomonas acroporae TaxID=1701104 RepID=UPI001580A50D|nr:hypothetical protein [Endozoicomonas acroporae]
MNGIWVRIEKQTISDAYLGRDYSNDEVFREQCQNWVNELWTEKDQLILSVRESHARAVAVEHE